MIDTITFFHPKNKNSKIHGGTFILFSRIINQVLLDNRYKVDIIDFEDGLLIQKFQKSSSLVSFQKNKKIKIHKNTYLIACLIDLPYLIKNIEVGKENKIHSLFWSTHRHSMFSAFELGFLRNYSLKFIELYSKFLLFHKYKRIRTYILNKIEGGCIVFMDGNNAIYPLNFFKINNQPNFLPIPIEKSRNELKPNDKDFSEFSEIRIAWLGRIAFEKIYPLLKFINQADDYINNKNLKVVIDIIGDGTQMDKLNDILLKSSNLSINCVGVKYGLELENHLKSVDLIIAMGTSALDGAKFKIPTLLLGPSNKKLIKNPKYTWLYNSTNYNLAHFNYNYDEKSMTFEEMMIDLFQNHASISSQSFSYVHNHHCIDSVVNKMYFYLEKIEVDFEPSVERKYFRNGLIENFFKKIKSFV